MEKKSSLINGFDYIGNRCGNFFRVSRSNKFGYINTKGDIVIPLIFDYLGDMKWGYSEVMKDNKWGAIDTKGDLIIPLRYDTIIPLSHGYFKIKSDNKWGIARVKQNNPKLSGECECLFIQEPPTSKL